MHWRFLLAWACLLAHARAAIPAPAAGVAIVRDAPWVAGDAVRDGAGEFVVLLQIAQLQRAHAAAGLVAVVNRDGFLRCGGERALRRAALTGVPVLKIGDDDRPPPSTRDDLFLFGGGLNEIDAAAVLADCLTRFGTPPRVADAGHPTAREFAAIREHLRPFQAALAIAAARHQVALR